MRKIPVALESDQPGSDMETMINRSAYELLLLIAAKRSIQIPGFSNRTLDTTEAEREQLIDLLTDEFIETGLNENDEPNQRGMEIEALIDILNTSADK